MVRKRGLGRGLDALLGEIADRTLDQPIAPSPSEDGGFRSLPVDSIRRGRHQPRRIVEESALEELADSVRARGIVQPIVVRSATAGTYEIVAGERRWRAARMAGMDEVPAVVRECSDQEAAAIALIENIQREDLNAIEEAQGYRMLADEFGLTHQELADAVGRSRSAVSNAMRLLELNEDVRVMVENGDIEMGHARALLALCGAAQSKAAEEVVRRKLTARETESLVRRLTQPETAPTPKVRDPDVVKLEDDLAERLGAMVRIQHRSKGTGTLTIHYGSLDALDGILERIH